MKNAMKCVLWCWKLVQLTLRVNCRSDFENEWFKWFFYLLNFRCNVLDSKLPEEPVVFAHVSVCKGLYSSLPKHYKWPKQYASWNHRSQTTASQECSCCSVEAVNLFQNLLYNPLVFQSLYTVEKVLKTVLGVGGNWATSPGCQLRGWATIAAAAVNSLAVAAAPGAIVALEHKTDHLCLRLNTQHL